MSEKQSRHIGCPHGLTSQSACPPQHGQMSSFGSPANGVKPGGLKTATRSFGASSFGAVTTGVASSFGASSFGASSLKA